MTTVYFFTNNYLFKNEIKYLKDTPKEKQKELLPLSFKGEKTASEFLKIEGIKKTKIIYTSNNISMISSAKYLSEEQNIPIWVEEKLKERRVGILGSNTEQFLKETQEHDFHYKFHNGESMQMTQDRMKEVLKDILFRHPNEKVAVFTHDIALEALFSTFCEKGYNLDNQMILNYKEEVIIDGAYHPYRIFKLEFEEMKLLSMTWLNKNE